MRKIEIVDCRGSQSFVFPPIMQEDGGIGSKQLKCQKQGQEKQAQCTLNKPIFCPNNGETLNLINPDYTGSDLLLMKG
jgi:hypothetical protein